MPDIPFNITPLLVCTIVGFFLSFIWYSALFGKSWAKEMGFDPKDSPAGAALFKSLGLTVLSVFLIAMVLSSNIAVWAPSTWGITTGGIAKPAQAFQAGIFTWMGFFLPTLIHGVAWEKRSWKLFAINAGYYLVLLMLMAFIIVYMR
jgi:Protein of unknown function (DUF1761)